MHGSTADRMGDHPINQIKPELRQTEPAQRRDRPSHGAERNPATQTGSYHNQHTHNTINPRTFNLTNTSDEPPLNHVLLVEDSWVSGATVQSAAAMLHQIGAEHVTIYRLARIIDLRWTRRELGEQVSNGIMALRHETHWCPWTLQKHKP